MSKNRKLITLLLTTVFILSNVCSAIAGSNYYMMDYSLNDNLFRALNEMTTTTLTGRSVVAETSKSGDFKKYVYVYALVTETNGSTTTSRGLYSSDTVNFGSTKEAKATVTKSYNQTMVKGYTKHEFDGGSGNKKYDFSKYYSNDLGILVTPN